MKTANKRLTRLERHTIDCILSWTYRRIHADELEHAFNNKLAALIDEEDDSVVKYQCPYGTTTIRSRDVSEMLRNMPAHVEMVLVERMKEQAEVTKKERRQAERLAKTLKRYLPKEEFEVIDFTIGSDSCSAKIKSTKGKEFVLDGPTYSILVDGFFDWVNDGVIQF